MTIALIQSFMVGKKAKGFLNLLHYIYLLSSPQ
jgi:hypothetical protein